jgi:hypothetical protein
MQMRDDDRMSLAIKLKFERGAQRLGEDGKRFFKLFEESTHEGSRAAALEMREIARRQIKHNQRFMLFHSLRFLAHSDSEMLLWPNSPLLALLQFVDPNVLSGNEDAPLQEGETRQTPLHHVSNLADPFDYSTHGNQLILAKQLIEHGANVHAVSNPRGETPLHSACYGGVVTNLDFVELLLEAGADPNSQDHQGLTPLMRTMKLAPGAAKFLLNWSTTDVNITTQSGESFLVRLQTHITTFSNLIARCPGSTVEDKFMLQQWRDVEEMLVERSAADTGMTAIE